jgi:hypothetical protein
MPRKAFSSPSPFGPNAGRLNRALRSFFPPVVSVRAPELISAALAQDFQQLLQLRHVKGRGGLN